MPLSRASHYPWCDSSTPRPIPLQPRNLDVSTQTENSSSRVPDGETIASSVQRAANIYPSAVGAFSRSTINNTAAIVSTQHFDVLSKTTTTIIKMFIPVPIDDLPRRRQMWAASKAQQQKATEEFALQESAASPSSSISSPSGSTVSARKESRRNSSFFHWFHHGDKKRTASPDSSLSVSFTPPSVLVVVSL